MDQRNQDDLSEDSFSNLRVKETKMSKYTKNASKSDLYARVKRAPVNARQRAAAMNALRDAEAISNAIMWVISAVRRLVSRTSTSASHLLHNH
jgi:hypothetical protein